MLRSLTFIEASLARSVWYTGTSLATKSATEMLESFARRAMVMGPTSIGTARSTPTVACAISILLSSISVLSDSVVVLSTSGTCRGFDGLFPYHWSLGRSLSSPQAGYKGKDKQL